MAYREKEKFERKRIKIACGLSMYTRISRGELPSKHANIVLVHGLSVSSGYMVPTAICLAPSYRVYVPDLPGFGRSQKPSHILNIAELADVLAEWMKALKLPCATFLGNSMGCQVIVQLILRHPELVERAVLVSPTMDPDARTIHQEAWRLFKDAPCEPLHFLPVLFREYFVAGIKRTIRTLRYALEDPFEEHLPHIHVPVVVVRGSRDPIVPQDWVEKVDSLLPDSQLIVVQGAGHAVIFNSPRELTQIVHDFIERKDSSHEKV